MCWGWFMGGFILYLSWGDDFKYQTLILVVSLFGVFMYPISKWVVEDLFLRFTTKEFWNKGLFMDTAGKSGVLAIYSGIVFIFTIPILMLYLVIVFVKRLPS